MSWSYETDQFTSTVVGAYPGSTVGERYQIRTLIQDTNVNRQLFQDEEIDWSLTQEANLYMAAAALADILVAKGGGVKSKRISEFEVEYDPRMYLTIATRLRARGMNYQVPYAGGISRADKAAQQADTDWVTPSFARGISDHPDAPKPSPNSPINPLQR
jgi:hypothetical protein